MGEPIRSYRDLVAWQKAFKLGLTLYRLAAGLPEAEKFGLISQMRRGAVDVASSIARGYGCGNAHDYLWFLKAARGELYKFDTQLLFASELKYITDETCWAVKAELEEAERVLAGLIRSLGGG
ncbi:MAG TPA: four helix bundle protein [Phycisphaerales bacterium]|nr:four helix bundle protein [Phycisphaerales bacterium]